MEQLYVICMLCYRILHIGCGSSQLSMELFTLGYQNISNLDYSQVLIDDCKQRHPEMKWFCDDIRSLSSIANEQYDVVLEKATLEALLVKEKVGVFLVFNVFLFRASGHHQMKH